MLSGDELVGIIDELMRELDSTAETLGVEPIRTVHNGYLASCGLNVPRLDSVPRTIDFAVEMQRIIERFNSGKGYHLGIRAGVNTGNVISGLVGRSSVIYDMWGAAVNMAHQMRSGTSESGIFVTTDVYEADARHPPVHLGRHHHRRRRGAADLATGGATNEPT